MKISARHDIMKPIDVVFAALTDYDHHERHALKNGIQLKRIGTMPPSWFVQAVYRGKLQEFELAVTEVVEPLSLTARIDRSGVEATFKSDLVALSPGKTRMILGVTLVPRSFRARLVLQSMRLARARLERGLASRIKAWAETI